MQASDDDQATTGMTDQSSLPQRARPVARGRTALGLLAAALLAPVVVGLVFSGLMAFPPSPAGPAGTAAFLRGDPPSANEFVLALRTFMPLSVVVGVGPCCAVAACLGVPVIWLLRRRRLTSPLVFAAAGLAVASVSAIGPATLMGLGRSRTEFLDLAIPLALAGTASGLMYWWIAERPWHRLGASEHGK